MRKTIIAAIAALITAAPILNEAVAGSTRVILP